MAERPVHVDSFQSGPDVTRRTTYKELRDAVLAAGRFSVFEATANPRAAVLFTDLCRDASIETFDLGYPWTGVRIKGAKASSEPQQPTTSVAAEQPAPAPKTYVIETEGRLFWRPDRCGYTDNIFCAGLYTEEEAKRQARSRDIDRAVPLRDALSELRVNGDVVRAWLEVHGG